MPKHPPVDLTTVHPTAKERALALAGGQESRLRPVSATVVIVVNHAGANPKVWTTTRKALARA